MISAPLVKSVTLPQRMWLMICFIAPMHRPHGLYHSWGSALTLSIILHFKKRSCTYGMTCLIMLLRSGYRCYGTYGKPAVPSSLPNNRLTHNPRSTTRLTCSAMAAFNHGFSCPTCEPQLYLRPHLSLLTHHQSTNAGRTVHFSCRIRGGCFFPHEAQ